MDAPVAPAPRRARNAAATRQAILISARAAFARAGYDGVGLREIAKGAGVTAMLVNRYFGSKEQLFAEVVANAQASPDVLSDAVIGSPTLARDITAALLGQTNPDATPTDAFLIMLHSASNPRAAAIWRELLEKQHLKALTEALGGELAAERAALVMSLITGFQAMRQMVGLAPLRGSEPEGLANLLTWTFQQLLSGGPDGPHEGGVAPAKPSNPGKP